MEVPNAAFGVSEENGSSDSESWSDFDDELLVNIQKKIRAQKSVTRRMAWKKLKQFQYK